MAENCNEGEEERAGRLARKQKWRESKCSHYPVKSIARSMSTRLREEQRLAKQRKCMIIDSSVTLLSMVWSSWETTISLRSVRPRSVPQLFQCTSKAHATSTNSNVQVSVKRLLRCAWDIHCKYVHLVKEKDVLRLLLRSFLTHWIRKYSQLAFSQYCWLTHYTLNFIFYMSFWGYWYLARVVSSLLLWASTGNFN